MRFIDEVTVQALGGKGGDGGVYWRREAHVPRGGPDGGNGGNGGAVVMVADPAVNTLIDLSYTPRLCAESGDSGSTSICNGKDGTDCVIHVPVGTQAYYQGTLVADLSAPGARWVAARGGLGGKGNAFFKSSTNQAPDYAEAGQPGESVELRLVLKSVADVGIVGLPNVGKSTLISVISEARPKVADYPFTTLRPTLGVVTPSDGKQRFVVADIPGLIPGAHQGRGLGVGFLKHLERTTVLVQLIDVTTPIVSGQTAAIDDTASDDELRRLALEQFDVINQELLAFSEKLAVSPRLIVFSKGELPQCRRAFELASPALAADGFKTLIISSHARSGLTELVEALSAKLCQRAA